MQKETAIIQDRLFSFESGLWAPRADKSITIRAGDGVVLVALVSASGAGASSFMPLMVDYRERAAAGGLIPRSYGNREGRPSTHETLSSRLIDRSLRPLFPKNYRAETQVAVTVFSDDPDQDLATLTITAASLALSLSDIPWAGPVAGVRVGRIDGQFVAFPTLAQREKSDMDFIVAVAPQGILMVEGEAEQVSESDLVACLMFAQESAEPLLKLQRDWIQKAAPQKRTISPLPQASSTAIDALQVYDDSLGKSFLIADKRARDLALKEVKKNALEAVEAAQKEVGETFEADLIKRVYSERSSHIARGLILKGERFDGRDHTTVRPIIAQVNQLPSSHGSSFFGRGETQALATCTLGGPRDRLRENSLQGEKFQSFYLHYNFPPYSVGEPRPIRGPGRREIGHGMLAQRALAPVLPSPEEFPYTVRVVSDILSSNGSSSMATVCAGCLSMLDAGVPLSDLVAGVAMGMVQEGEEIAILTDILGDEDHLGDMDFKVCGTVKGVTALQMDLKIEGLTDALLERALSQARVARLHILGEMKKALPKSRDEVAANAEMVHLLRVRSEHIAGIIGPGGRNLRKIEGTTGAKIEVGDNRIVRISGKDRKGVAEAVRMLEVFTRVAKIGEIFNGIVTRTNPNFAIVELFPGTDGFLHISEVEEIRIESVQDVLRVGDRCLVKLIKVDDRGKIQISRRAAMKRRKVSE